MRHYQRGETWIMSRIVVEQFRMFVRISVFGLLHRGAMIWQRTSRWKNVIGKQTVTRLGERTTLTIKYYRYENGRLYSCPLDSLPMGSEMKMSVFISECYYTG